MQINLPQNPKIVKKEGHRAIFEIEGLYPGYGVTLGNSLRRVLLSSLPGAAVTGVKIKGVQHEFSTIPHVMEDAIELILNLRQARFKLFSSEPVKLSLSVKGEKEIKVGDIKTTSDIEIINPEAHLATLTDKKAELEIEIEVDKGFGFVPVEARHKEKLEIGMIAVDAVFSPMKKVNFEVENMRVGDRTDFNRLRLDIETDGSISAEEAFKKASEILAAQFGALADFGKAELSSGEEKEEEEGKDEAGEEAVEETADISKTKLEETKLSRRTLNALTEGGIKTIGALSKKTEEEILEIEGMGEKGAAEVKKILKKFDLILKE